MQAAVIEKIKQWMNRVLNFWVFVFDRFKLDGCFSTAAALAFTTILSLVPFMTVTVSILRIMPSAEKLGQQSTDFIFKNFVPATGEVVHQYLQLFIQQAGQLTWIGALFLIVTSLMMLVTMENVLNAIWRVPSQRKGMAAFVVYWSLLTLAPIFIAGSVGISSYFFSLHLFDITTDAQRNRFITAYLPFILTTCGFTFLYVIMPNCKVKIKHAFVGGVVAACLFELSKRGFSLYIANFPAYKLLYGALATIPIFLFWIYLAWVVALFGAEVTNALSYDHRQKRSGTGHYFIISYVWIYVLWQAQKHGESVSLGKLVKKYPAASAIEIDQIIRALLKAQLIRHTLNGEYILTRNLSHLTLYEFYALLPWQIPHPSELQKVEKYLIPLLEPVLEKTDTELKKILAMPLAETFEER